jgi:cell division protein ZipA
LQANDLGRRVEEQYDKIVSLFVAARAGHALQGPDIMVAAEKAGLVFGHMDVSIG